MTHNDPRALVAKAAQVQTTLQVPETPAASHQAARIIDDIASGGDVERYVCELLAWRTVGPRLATALTAALDRNDALTAEVDDGREREIEERLAKATPGPWSNNWPSRRRNTDFVRIYGNGSEVARVNNDRYCTANAHMLTNAPADLAYLLARVRALTGELAAERERATWFDSEVRKVIEAPCDCRLAPYRTVECVGTCARSVVRRLMRLEE